MAIYNFIDPVAGDSTAGVLSTGTSFIAGNSGDIGLWNLDGRYMNTGSGDDWANTDFLSTSYGLATPIADIDTGDGSVNIQGDINMYTIVPDRFQVVQQRSSGQPFATPILKREDIWQINYVPYTLPVKAKVVNNNLTDPASGDIHDLKYVCTACPTDYREVENSDMTGNCRVGQVFNVTVGSGYTAKDDLGAAAVTAINDSVFGRFVTASYNTGGDDLTVAAKAEGFDFDEVSVTEVGGDGTSHIPAGTKTAMVIGNGSLKKVRGMEEKSLANFGYHNRLWFKQTPDLFGATAATNGITGFDLFQIVAKVDGWKGSMGKKGREDVIVNMWIDQAAASASGETIDITFHVTSDTSTATTYNFNGAGFAASQGE